MNMKKVMMMVALAGCALGAMTLSSCGSDDDNNGGNTGTEPTPAYWTFEAVYVADPSACPDTKNVFDITAQYPDGKGGMKIETGVEQNTTTTVAKVTSMNLDGTSTTVELKGKTFAYTSSTFGGNDEVTFTFVQAIKSSYVYAEGLSVDPCIGYRYTVYDKNGNSITSQEHILYQKLQGINKWDAFKSLYPKTIKYTVSVSKDGTLTVE